MDSAGASGIAHWPGSHQPEFNHHNNQMIDSYNIAARPMSQPALPPQSSGPLVQVCADAKPRLTKDQHEILEAHFRQQPKPSTSIKKGYAERLGVPLDKINNWFQNRRAKVKQEAKKAQNQIQLYNTLNHHSGHFFGHHQPVAAPMPVFYGRPPVVPSNIETAPEQIVGPQMPQFVQSPNIPAPGMQNTSFDAPVSFGPSTLPNSTQALEAQDYSSAPSNESLVNFNFDFTSFDESALAASDSYDFMSMGSNAMEAGQMTSTSNGETTTTMMPNGLPSYTSHSTVDEDEKLRLQVDSPQDIVDFSSSSGHPTPADSTTTWSSVLPGSEFYEKQNMSTPALMQSQDSPVSAISYEQQESPALAESMINVNFNSPSESESSFKAPTVSGLAARRQKPRPANLAPTAIRSASYTAGMPGSPGTTATPGSQDQLRRIRSHGINGPPGRISKPGAPQKSPLHSTFDAAAVNSPKFARHASNFSVSTGPPTSLAPPTPVTPNDFSRFPMGQMPGYGFVNGSPSAFSHMGGDDPIYFDSSSPMAKLDVQQMHQFTAGHMARHDAFMFQTPPQSAPAHQQNFSFHPQARPIHAPAPNGLGHTRRISLPDAQHGHELKHFQPQPQMFQGQIMQQPQLNGAFNADSAAFAMGQGMHIQNDFEHSMPLQLSVPQRSESGFHFHNQTPDDYRKNTGAS